MEIIETSIYTQNIIKLLSDEEYLELQNFLVSNPKAGDVIQNSGGLRKLRWKLKNKGKSSGIRNIYYFYEQQSKLYMIYVYKKSKKDDLTPDQIKKLKKAFLGE
ncbi:MAG: hypothetical protein CR967_00070 [Proteobacteria bacterium]|nr:MAG: hypothetical protein CR967_00070 [Pseudomonadota bacterium]